MRYQVTLCVMRLHYALSGYIMRYDVTICIMKGTICFIAVVVKLPLYPRLLKKK